MYSPHNEVSRGFLAAITRRQVRFNRIAIVPQALALCAHQAGLTLTRGKFVPEQSTDFIFCTIGEEHGFLGSFLVVLLYLFFILRIISLAERKRSSFSRVYGYSVACIFFVHFAINI